MSRASDGTADGPRAREPSAGPGGAAVRAAADGVRPDGERRRLLGGIGATLIAGGAAPLAARADVPPSWRAAGAGFTNYGLPAADTGLVRWITHEPSAPGNGASWTPLHALAGAITPNGLHFERHHNGVPTLDPTRWSMTLEGLVRRPLTLDLEALRRRPQRAVIAVLECGGNSNALWRETPVQAPSGWLHGLVSSGEWSGVPLAALLDEARPRKGASWLVATGLDGAGVTVSLPLATLPPGALVALHRNGEPLRPEHGWPARLLLPGHEGIASVKWLGRLELSDRPAMSRFDSVAYTDLGKGGVARRFSRVMGVKSVLTSPSVGDTLEPGPLELSGLAWSGAGAIRRVEVSVDGGRHWRDAALEPPVLERAFVRFRLPWRWERGAGALLQTRAEDTSGRVQPTRAALLDARGANGYYHYHAILSASVEPDGRVRHVHA